MPSPTRAAMEDKRRSGPRAPLDPALLVARIALAAAVLLFMPGLLEQFETAKAFAVRVLGIGLLGLLATRAPASRARGLLAMDVAVLAWLAVELAATAFSVNPLVSLVGDVEQHEGLLTSLGLA